MNEVLAGDWESLLAAVALLVASWFAEAAMLRYRWTPYFTFGFPLGAEPLPLPAPPKGSGATRAARWESVDGGWARFWADPAQRASPNGLRGAVVFLPTRAGVRLAFRWSPPWTPYVALVWLAAIGTARGDAHVAIPLALALGGGALVLYHQAALRLSAELRFAFARALEESAP